MKWTTALPWIQHLIALQWPLRLFNPVFGRFNPFLSEYRRDPYPFYDALRSSQPVYFSRVFRLWVVTCYDDVTAVLRDDRFSADRERAKIVQKLDLFGALPQQVSEFATRNLLNLDPPDHTRLRDLVNRAFTPRILAALEPRIQRIVDELLDRAADAGRLDLVREFATPLPVTVIAEMLGLPPEVHPRLKVWSDDLLMLLDPFHGAGGIEPLERSFAEAAGYFRDIFEERRQQPQDDLISALVHVEEAGDRLSDVELMAMCILILVAGHETTTNLIGNAVVALLRNPEERARLQEDRLLIGSAVEEFLRYNSPVQLTERVATRDCALRGQRIREGQIVWLVLGAANRDPAQFHDPGRLDLGRPDNRHVAFGHGAHFCLGAHLARAEARIAIASLLRRFPNLEGEPDPPDWKRSIVLRGPEELELSLARRAL